MHLGLWRSALVAAAEDNSRRALAVPMAGKSF